MPTMTFDPASLDPAGLSVAMNAFQAAMGSTPQHQEPAERVRLALSVLPVELVRVLRDGAAGLAALADERLGEGGDRDSVDR